MARRMKSIIRRRLRVYEPEVDAGLIRAQEIVHKIDERLFDGREYLVGDRFSAADLTLACMMAPFVLPAQYGIRLPTIEEVPIAMRETVRGFRNSAAGQFTLRLFAMKRRPAVAGFKHDTKID